MPLQQGIHQQILTVDSSALQRVLAHQGHQQHTGLTQYPLQQTVMTVAASVAAAVVLATITVALSSGAAQAQRDPVTEGADSQGRSGVADSQRVLQNR